MDIEANEKVYNTPFSEQLLFNMKQLNYRMNRLSEIDSTKADNQNEYLSSQASENNFLNIVKKLDSIIIKERA